MTDQDRAGGERIGWGGHEEEPDYFTPLAIAVVVIVACIFLAVKWL